MWSYVDFANNFPHRSHFVLGAPVAMNQAAAAAMVVFTCFLCVVIFVCCVVGYNIIIYL
jgi:hypothetical protein